MYSTASHQEMFDYTIKGFNAAWKYRFPTFLLGDGYQAKMREPLTLYEPEERGIEIVEPIPILGKSGQIGVDREPQHLCNIYNMEEELYDVVLKLVSDFEAISPEVIEYEEHSCADAEILVLSHGVVSRAADDAVRALRAQGIKVGYFRPITLRPFPRQALLDAIHQSGAKTMVLAESSYGQFARLVGPEIFGETIKIVPLFKPGVGIVDYDIINLIKSLI